MFTFISYLGQYFPTILISHNKVYHPIYLLGSHPFILFQLFLSWMSHYRSIANFYMAASQLLAHHFLPIISAVSLYFIWFWCMLQNRGLQQPTRYQKVTALQCQREKASRSSRSVLHQWRVQPGSSPRPRRVWRWGRRGRAPQHRGQ